MIWKRLLHQSHCVLPRNSVRKQSCILYILVNILYILENKNYKPSSLAYGKHLWSFCKCTHVNCLMQFRLHQALEARDAQLTRFKTGLRTSGSKSCWGLEFFKLDITCIVRCREARNLGRKKSTLEKRIVKRISNAIWDERSLKTTINRAELNMHLSPWFAILTMECRQKSILR